MTKQKWTRRLAALLMAGCILGGLVPAGLAFAEEAPIQATVQEAPLAPEDTPSEASAPLETVDDLALADIQADTEGVEPAAIEIHKVWQDGAGTHPQVHLTLTATYKTAAGEDGTFSSEEIVLKEGDGQNWIWSAERPTRVTVTTTVPPQNPDDPEAKPTVTTETADLAYTVTEAPLEGYAAPVIDSSDGRIFTVTNAKLTDLTASLVWLDGGNDLATRPDILGKLTLHRGTPAAAGDLTTLTEETGFDGNAFISVVQEGDTAVLTAGGMPLMTADGSAVYTYWFTLDGLTGGDSRLTPASTDEVTAKDPGAADVQYALSLENADNYGNSPDAGTTRIYPGGTVTAPLEGHTAFSVKKVWWDELTETAEQDTKRPDTTLTLWVYPDDEEHGPTAASPVLGRDVIEVSKAAAAGAELPLEFAGAGPGGDGQLPLFDATGRMLVYFARESMKAADPGYVYSQHITNPDGGAFAGVTDVLYNQGKIENVRTGTVNLSAAKQWEAAARQAMNATVTMAAQQRLAADGADAPWKDVLDGAGQPLTLKLEDFKAETPAKAGTFEALPRFDEQGREYEYRVVERGVSMHFGDTDHITTVQLSDGAVYFPFLAQKGDETKYDGYNVTYEKTGDGWAVTNQLAYKTEVRVIKVWKQGADANTPDITLHLQQNGVDLKEETLTSGTATAGSVTIDGKTYTTWAYTFADLDKFDGEGNEYDYAVQEDVDGGYFISYSYDYAHKDEETSYIGITVTNDPVGPGASIAVRKVWNDDGDVQHRQPVTAAAYKADGTEVGRTTLDETGHWEGYIGLNGADPKDVIVRESALGAHDVVYDGQTYTSYGALADAVPPPADEVWGHVATGEHLYNAVVKKESDTSYLLTNTRVGGVNITVNKEWVDGGRYGVLTAEEIQAAGGTASEAHTVKATFTLSGGPDSIASREQTLTGPGTADAQTLTWTDLPKYDEMGKLYTYNVSETMDAVSTALGCDYQGTIGMDSYIVGTNHTADQVTYTAVNRRTGTVDPFQVHKIWLDGVKTPEEAVSLRPNIFLKVERSTDGGKTWVPAGNNGYLAHTWNKDTLCDGTDNLTWWTATFAPQPKYDGAGNLYDYNITEGLSGNAGDKYAQYYYDTSPTADGTFDESDPANVREDRGAAPNGTIVNRLEDTRTLNIRKYWKYGNKNLPAGDVPEAVFDLYYKTGAEYKPALFILDKAMDGVTDVLTLQTDADAGLPALAAVNAGQGKTGTFTVEVGGKKFTVLPKYDTLGHEIAYYAKEQPVDGYAVSGGAEYLDLGAATRVVDNSYTNDASVTVQLTKATVGTPLTGDAGCDKLPAVTLKLQYKMQHKTDEGLIPAGEWKDYSALAAVIGGDAVYTAKPGDWAWDAGAQRYVLTHDFTGLPGVGANGQPYLYRVTDSVSGYTADGTEAQGEKNKTAEVELTNTYTGGALTLRLTKTWAGAEENKYGDRPGLTVTVRRYLDTALDKMYEPITLTDALQTPDGTWVWEVKNDEEGEKAWPRYAPNGEAYRYTVQEAVPAGYTAGDTGEVGFAQDNADKTLFTAGLTNTLDPVSYSVRKIWAGDDTYKNVLRPAAVTVQLQRTANADGTDWEAVQDTSSGQALEAVLGEGTGWDHTWDNLPGFDQSGKAYAYRAVEVGTSYAAGSAGYSRAGAYDITYDGTVPGATAITNTLAVTDVKVTKVWADSSNYAGARPDSIQLYLTTGDETRDTALSLGRDNPRTLNADDPGSARNEWAAVWTGLPARDKDGRALSYIVKEMEESLEKAGYTVSYNSGGTTVVNSRAAGGTNVTVEKLWTGDNENLRPRQITVKLLADGQELTDRSVTLPRQDEAGKAVWRYTWEGLPKATEAGSTIRYTVQEVPVAGYDAAVEQDGSYFTITNTLQAGDLEIEKTRLGGIDEMFNFIVTLTPPDKSAAAYAGPYKVTGTDGAVRDAYSADGTVTLRGGETALLSGLPAGWTYAVEEKDRDGFTQTAAEGAAGVITVDGAARAAFTNTAYTELEIDNRTDNPGIQYAGGQRPTNAGGTVAVQTSPVQPDLDPWRRDETSVAWTPDAGWTHTDSFIVRYWEFGEDSPSEVTVTGWLNADGSVKPISDPAYDALRARFPGASITQEGTVVRLTLAGDADAMPRRAHVEVRFAPTLAVENITVGDAGGTVAVQGGTAGTVSDGVPGQDGHGRYSQTVVTGTVAEGWAAQAQRITLGVPGSSAGDSPTAAVLTPDNAGRFKAIVTVPVAGQQTQVEVTGTITVTLGEDGLAVSVTVTLDSLPVPLDIGIGFYQKGAAPLPPIPGGDTGGTGANPDANINTGTSVTGTPQTGDGSPLALFGLLLAAGVLGVAVTGFLRARRRRD